jgi:hypothetical protein
MAVRRMTRSVMPAGPSPSSARTRRRGLLPWTPNITAGPASGISAERHTTSPQPSHSSPSTICQTLTNRIGGSAPGSRLKYQQLSTARNRRSARRAQSVASRRGHSPWRLLGESSCHNDAVVDRGTHRVVADLYRHGWWPVQHTITGPRESEAIQSISPGDPITVEHLLDFHRRLLTDTRLGFTPGSSGPSRTGSAAAPTPLLSIVRATPHEMVRGLLDDLCTFCSDDSLPAVAQAAIAHAQFETIHPFVDGNGRTSRALIHLVLRRRGLATRILLPVSLVLATCRPMITSPACKRPGTGVRHPLHPLTTASTSGWRGLRLQRGAQSMMPAVSRQQRSRCMGSGRRSSALASPEGNTRTSKPARRVPGRRLNQ